MHSSLPEWREEIKNCVDRVDVSDTSDDGTAYECVECSNMKGISGEHKNRAQSWCSNSSCDSMTWHRKV